MDWGLFDPFSDLSNPGLTPRLMDQDLIIINTQVLFHNFYFKSLLSFSMIAPRLLMWLLWAILPFSTCRHVGFFLQMQYTQFSISLKCFALEPMWVWEFANVPKKEMEELPLSYRYRNQKMTLWRYRHPISFQPIPIPLDPNDDKIICYQNDQHLVWSSISKWSQKWAKTIQAQAQLWPKNQA